MGESKTYADYLIEGRNQLINHKHMMPVAAHAPVKGKVTEYGRVAMPRMSDETLEKYVIEARERESKLNKDIRQEIVREIQRDTEVA